MTKFYTDGKDDLILYGITNLSGETKYSKNEDCIDKALIDWIYKSRLDLTDSQILSGYDFTWWTKPCGTKIVEIHGTKKKLVEKFVQTKIIIPNGVFDPMPTSSDSIPCPAINTAREPSTVVVADNNTTIPASSSEAITDNHQTVIRNPFGNSVGIIKTVGVTDDQKSDTSDAATYVTTVYGNKEPIKATDAELFYSRLNAAIHMYGSRIRDFIVKDSRLLNKDSIYELRSLYLDKAETDSSLQAYVFSLHDFSVHCLHADGTHVTLL